VTVVATGLGRDDEILEQPKVVAYKNTGEVDYSQLERPAVIRNQNVAVAGGGRHRAVAEADLDYLDIPAFLRRQAD
jgi:cell division protein FtsZ